MITVPHYHIATGHDSINRGKLYPCASSRCCIEPAWADADGARKVTV